MNDLKDISDSCVLVAVVIVKISLEVVHSLCSACHNSVDIAACNSDGKKTYCGKNGISSADIVSDNEGLVAFLVGKLLEGSSRLIGGGEDPLLSAFLAVLLLDHLSEYSESKSRLGSCTGLGNYVNGKILALAERNDLIEICGGNVVAHIVDIGCVFLQIIVKRRLHQLDSSSCAQVGTTDADNDKYIGILLDLLGSSLDPCKLFLVVVYGEIGPAEEIISSAALILKDLCSKLSLSLSSFHFMRSDKALKILCIKM